ncbi:Hypothetical predicted protein [Cloeon dipterum]|uniref:Uncharacterized protein n=1 Tax=Cloeon dipterum TaxID=197152 RepID=A0A8S1CY82_9INSE|nr:Hypothetical predicted protein [Cloeon dipterum]
MARLSISWLSCFGIIFVVIASFKVHHISAYNSGSGTNRTTEDSNFFTMQCSGAASVVWFVLFLLLTVIAGLEYAYFYQFYKTSPGSEQEEIFRQRLKQLESQNRIGTRYEQSMRISKFKLRNLLSP